MTSGWTGKDVEGIGSDPNSDITLTFTLGIEQTTKYISQDSLFPSCYLKAALPKYEADMPTVSLATFIVYSIFTVLRFHVSMATPAGCNATVFNSSN
jgi:hypothetical protein